MIKNTDLLGLRNLYITENLDILKDTAKFNLDILNKHVEDPNTLGYDIDFRLQLFTYYTTKLSEMQQIVKYTTLFYAYMQSVTNIKTPVRLGLFPVAYFPSYLKDSVSLVESKLNSIGLPVFKKVAFYLYDGIKGRQTHYDIYTSRMELSNYLGKAPEDVRYIDVLKILLEKEVD